MHAAVQARLDEFTSTAQRRGVASVETRMLEDDARFALLLESRYADLVVVSREAEPITVPARQSSDPVRPLAQDKRFSDPAWSAWPWHQRWQDFLPYVDPDNWQTRVPQADGSWWPAWESRLTRHAGSNVAPPAPLANAAPAPGNYVLQV